MELKNTQKLDQQLYLGTEMLTSIQLLAFSSLELLDYLQNEIENNPAIDSDDLVCELSKANVDIDCYEETGSYDQEKLESVYDFKMQSLTTPVTMAEYLEGQLEENKFDEPVRNAALWIIHSLNPDGYFMDEDLMPRDLHGYLKAGLEAVQSLSPPGIGARNLAESLKIQARCLGIEDKVLYQMIEEDLNLLAERKFEALKRKYGISDGYKYLEMIRSLNPRPASAIPNLQPTQYITVDAYFEKVNGVISVRLNDNYIPRIKVNSGYSELLSQLDGEAKGTYQNFATRVSFLNQSIQKRNKTLLSVCEAIIQRQAAYFSGRSHYLAPLILSDIAEDVGLHLSTVSRAVQGKYVSYQ